jgi:NADH dehydrogenase
MLHEIAASDLEITNIVNPLRKLLRRAEVLVGEVKEIDLPNRRVLLARGYHNHSQEIDYNHLVIALGSITNFYDNPGSRRLGRAHEIASRCNSFARSNPPASGRGKL